MPLPLAVKTPQDLAIKAIAEKQYLIFNLLAGGKLAWDAGEFATAATKWDTLLRVPGLDPEIERVIRPLAVAARERSGEKAPAAASAPRTPGNEAPLPPSSPIVRERVSPVTVSGTIAGGGSPGPGGAVVWPQARRTARRRAPRPRAARSSASAARPSSPTCWPSPSARRWTSATTTPSITTFSR